MTKRPLPSSASVANQGEGDRLIAPAATRNADALCELLCQWAPDTGKALELASGTGQHVSAFAQCLPNVFWQPTEVAADRRHSIDAYAGGLSNVAPAVALNATENGWHQHHGGQNLIVLINLVHLISWQETQTLVGEAAQTLLPGGRFILYGPFKRGGKLTSDGDQRFNDALIQQDPAIGYKDDTDIAGLMTRHGLTILETVTMPANNLAFVAEKPPD
ncbi:DUF938 domain-containing protein [Ruegeria meonggei]|uniref:Methyltransferase domain protein n=1 Tax=Ruegeria meonggei TaxID=1446476 RepID=A0A1X6YL05_9RHOB|nr:DUF938 domain-containing protein [Ruegeria meonggei]SLN23951.1 hypothetical protein RUM8411_00935 [Ruegeria meonggei]